MTPEEIKSIVLKCNRSSFNKGYNSTNIFLTDLDRFINSIELYTDYNTHSLELKNKDVDLFFEKVIPGFQRSNDKWDDSMKQRFVENILSGCDTEIKIFWIGNDDLNGQILDGLQRTTAIIEFFQGKVKPFGLTFNDLEEHMREFRYKIVLKIYQFNNIEEVGRFYIDMNDKITHSPEDIEKAKKYFRETYNINL